MAFVHTYKGFCSGMITCWREAQTHQSFCGRCEEGILSEEVRQQVLLCKARCSLSTVPVKHLHKVERACQQLHHSHTMHSPGNGQIPLRAPTAGAELSAYLLRHVEGYKQTPCDPRQLHACKGEGNCGLSSILTPKNALAIVSASLGHPGCALRSSTAT